MKLTIKDRLYIPSLLNPNNSFLEFNLKMAILKKVSLTEKDKDDFNIVEDAENKTITWDSKKDINNPLVVEFSSEELRYMKASCEKIADTPYPDDFWVTVQKVYEAVK